MKVFLQYFNKIEVYSDENQTCSLLCNLFQFYGLSNSAGCGWPASGGQKGSHVWYKGIPHLTLKNFPFSVVRLAVGKICRPRSFYSLNLKLSTFSCLNFKKTPININNSVVYIIVFKFKSNIRRIITAIVLNAFWIIS